MFLLQCDGCGTTATVQCTCPPEMADVPAHLAACVMNDPSLSLACPPGSGCCDGSAHPGQSHDQAANSCPGNHQDAACPEPETCRTWASQTADARHPAYTGPPPGPCPGGHCHKDLEDCKGCRPMTITFIGVTQIGMVS